MASRRTNLVRLPTPERRVAAGVEEFGRLIGKAESLHQQGRTAEAIEAYRQWIGPGLRPMAHAALFNLGVMLSSSGQHAQAMAAYRRAIELARDFLEPRLNLGSLLEQSGKTDEAIAVWTEATEPYHQSNAHRLALRVQALNNVGRVLENARRYPEAEAVLERSLMLNPQQPDVIQHWVHLRQKQCKWPVMQPVAGLAVADLLQAASPLAMLAHTDEPSMQLLASSGFVRRKLPAPSPSIGKAAPRAGGRLRIGYLSGDLCVHAVGLLMAEVIEQHDRERFEIVAFDFSHDDGSAYQARLRAAFDQRHAIRGISDEAAARLIADSDIDLLIDLQGLSSGARPGILAMRPAPVQVGWLGFIGTSAMPWIDYVIADRFTATSEMQASFTEKILPMGTPMLPRDSRREAGAATTRAVQGLPDDKFVFASFNNSYKLNPQMFAAWMDILRRTPDSVLWLLDDNPSATANLTREAMQAGIAPDRLVFAPRCGFADFIGRLQLADLFLDNHPYNAGSTARDVLYAGLPMLTLSGRSPVSRMAGSLLIDAGLPELVSFNHASYVETAVALAGSPQQIARLRQKLTAYRERATDTDAQVRALEAALLQACGHTGQDAALQPAHAIEQAVNASKSLPPQSIDDLASADDTRAVICQIAYSPDTLAMVKPPMRVLNNLANPRPDWRELWPIRQFLLTQALDENRFYGFLSPRFQEKTGLTADELQRFAEAQGDDVDVLSFSPQADMGAFFLNVFEQAEAFDPGFAGTAQAFFDAIQLPVQVDAMVMDSRHIVFSNYLLAKPRFWRAWLALNEKLFALCEREPASALAAELLRPTAHADGVQRKVFVSERIASVLLSIDRSFKAVRHPRALAAWSVSRLGGLQDEAIVSDALKAAMREAGQPEYRAAFARLRDRIIQQHLDAPAD